MSRKSSHKEEQESLHKSIYKIDTLFKQRLSLQEIGELLPGTLHLNALDDFSLQYFDESGEDVYKCSYDVVKAEGYEIMDKVIHHKDTIAILPHLQKYVINQDASSNISFFQRLKGIGKKHYEWYFTNCKLSDVGLVSITHAVKDLRNHGAIIEKVLEEHTFFKKNFKKFQSLTKREREVLKELAIGKTAPQISGAFFISVNTVKTHRQRIFEKLEVNTFTELYKYAFHFDLL
ncbi:helix-turn-helix transcriptional regulator [Tamlana sp. 2201CG12-4]|uniref:response regulator transcription factor n=1 Tax=Tamlana sp. 2201CG12-4 TaxID=3112582 RepID=UPI002DB7A28D|nr:helix-turn-helix transcriptional regulator [Tamlana sp. 2201CG12-4]MEC3908736.1 helix-turn-helix transcriptional regulator [Tamlana sp. 2201CG12-4]